MLIWVVNLGGIFSDDRLKGKFLVEIQGGHNSYLYRNAKYTDLTIGTWGHSYEFFNDDDINNFCFNSKREVLSLIKHFWKIKLESSAKNLDTYNASKRKSV